MIFNIPALINKFSRVLFITVLFISSHSCGNDDTRPIEEDKFSIISIDSPSEIRGIPIAITHVNVIPMTETNKVLSNQTVIIEDEMISWIGSAEDAVIPAGAEVINTDGNGYLIPGLADMHFHRSTVKDLFLFVANGVTVVREMWGSTAMVALRDQILDEKADLPQVFVASPGMNGSGGAWEQFTPPVTDPDEARLLVKQYKEEGFDFIKVYNLLEPEVYDAIIDELRFRE